MRVVSDVMLYVSVRLCNISTMMHHISVIVQDVSGVMYMLVCVRDVSSVMYLVSACVCVYMMLAV